MLVRLPRRAAVAHPSGSSGVGGCFAATQQDQFRRQHQQRSIKWSSRDSATSSSVSTPGAKRFDFNASLPILCHGTAGPQPVSHAYATKGEMVRFLKLMTRGRRMELVCDDLFKQQKIRGLCHLYDGQEAIAAGMEAAMSEEDAVSAYYRSHVWQITRGDNTGVGSMEAVFAEVMGKYTGCSKGKGGSMHMYNAEANFYGGNSSYTSHAQIAQATGSAFAFQYTGTKQVSFAVTGEGGENKGTLYESMNIAALWKLPVIYVICNVKTAIGTSNERGAAMAEYYKRGQYIPGLRVDGMDVLCVRDCTQFAIEHCRAGLGPFVLEMDAYRYHGWTMSDNGVTYRTRDDIKLVRSTRDPIDMTKQRIIDAGWHTSAELNAMDKEVRKEIDVALRAAMAARPPPLEALFDDVLIEEVSTRAVELRDSRVVDVGGPCDGNVVVDPLLLR
jgi:pyruvate dehydrogenase E1 component alpha subunit